MIPDVDREILVKSLGRFDEEMRGSPKWTDWETKKNNKYALRYEGRLYPVKQTIRLAVGAERKFSGGEQANSYLRERGFEVVALHVGQKAADKSVAARDAG